MLTMASWCDYCVMVFTGLIAPEGEDTCVILIGVFLVRRKLNLSRLGFLRGKQSFFSCVECVDGTCSDNMLDKGTEIINHNTRRVIRRAILNAIPSGRV